MECAACRSVNPETALECGRCGRPLRARAPSRTEPVVAFPAVGTRIEGWALAGPLVITERGLVFFVRDMRIVKANFTQAGIRTGGLVGLAIGALVDSARGRYDRPEKISLRPASEIIDEVQHAVADAPDIQSCREFFMIERRDISRISRAALGGLKIETPALTFRVEGFDRVDRASGFLKLRRYPVEA